jgi:phage terminase small subunit
VTKKQQIFVREYSVDFNATRAAIAAGYSEKGASVAGVRLLANVKIHAKIDENLAKRSEKLDISAEYVLKTIKDTMERCAQEREVLDKKGKPTGIYQFDPASVLKGAELLGKYHRLFTERIEHSGQIEHIDLSALSEAQLDTIERIVESAQSGEHSG